MNIKKSKEELIAEIDKRIEDKVIEQTNADLLKKLINNADTLTEAISIATLGTTYKRTGFHFDKRLEKMTDTIKYFKKNEELSFKTSDDAITHKLIIGDNYDALLNLLVEYKGKIDVIYIDPPYGKDSMGEFADTNYNNAITRDNLLSMLYPRLVLAKQLLSDSGVIFCSIDDKNQAHIKCLFDEVFGESNFLLNTIIKSNPRGSQASKHFATMHEYILIYAKDEKSVEIGGYEKSDENIAEYSLEDDGGKYRLLGLRQRGGAWKREQRPKLYYPIYVNPKNNKVSLEKTNEYSIEVLPHRPTGEAGRWTWSTEKVKQNIDLLVGKKVNRVGQDDFYDIFRKNHLISDTGEQSMSKPKSIWDEKDMNYQNGRTELKEVLNDDIFDYPKPTALIKQVMSMFNDEAITVLDFFAGSGTTGQAVLELNNDGGQRQFILATANEITDTTPNGIVKDVTSKRLKRIMTGECYDGTNNFKWLEKNKPLGDNLDVYNISTVSPYEATEGQTSFDVIDESLYSQNKLSVNDKIKWVCENFDGTQKTVETDDKYNERVGGE